MSTSGLALGIIALLLVIALLLELVLDIVGLIPFLVAAIAVVACAVPGLFLSGMGLLRGRRKGQRYSNAHIGAGD